MTDRQRVLVEIGAQVFDLVAHIRHLGAAAAKVLARRFGSTAWNGGTVGTFSIQFRFRSAADRLVTSAMFRLGDAQF